MKLTNTRRNAIVAAIMADVPFVDYKELYRIKTQEFALQLLPPKVKALHDEGLESYLSRMDVLPIENGWCMGWVTVYAGREIVFDNELTDAQKAELQDLHDKHEAQAEQCAELKKMLKSALYGCTTIKRAKEMLPEFDKYFDDEPEKTANLPAITGLADAFRNAGLKLA